MIGEAYGHYKNGFHAWYVAELQAAGVDAEVDVYHTNVHAFDMIRPEDALSKQAVTTLERQFERAFARATQEENMEVQG